MKTYAFINKKTSLVTSTATYPEGFLNPLEVHPDYICLELSEPLEAEKVENLYYKDGVLLIKPPAPGEFYMWDPENEVYVEDLEKAKEHYIKELRIAHRQGETRLKVFYKNVWYNASAQAESDLVSAILTEAFPQNWRSLDNQNQVLTLEDAKALLNKVRTARLSFKEGYWKLREYVESATNLSMIPKNSIDLFVQEHRKR